MLVRTEVGSNRHPLTTPVRLIVVGLLFCGMVGCERNGDPQRSQSSESALSTRELPAGVEDRWNVYVDQLLSQRLRRDGTWIRADLTDNFEADHASAYFRENMGVTVICNTTVLDQMVVVFDLQTDANVMVVVGGIETSDEPEMPVPWESAAGRELRERLCLRVRANLEQYLSSGSVALSTAGEPARHVSDGPEPDEPPEEHGRGY